MDFPLSDTQRAALDIPPIDFRGELNDEQYAAVTARPGPSLVLAGAGSGKTRTLIYRVAYLMSQGVRPGEILLLTFTNKAAREMLHRVEHLTGIPAARFQGGTFHHTGQKILRIHGELVGLGRNYNILDSSEAESVLRDAVLKIDPSFFKNKSHPKPNVLSDIFSMARNTCLTVDAAIMRYFSHFEDLDHERLTSFLAAYQKLKRDQQVADYDDLLEYLLQILNRHDDIRAYYQERFRYLLVDEYQDTNKIQAEIIDLIAAHHRVMAVGDDAQCIYSWRGADFQNIITFPDRHPGAQIYKIEVNYRSTPEILRFANEVFASHPAHAGFEKKLRPARPSSVLPYVVPAIDTKAQAQFVINKIEELVDEGRRLSDIAILYRAHYQAVDLQMELSRKRIPFQITSGVRFFEQAHVRDLTAQLRFASNPRDLVSFQRIAALLPKIGEKTAAKLLALAKTIAEKRKISIYDALISEEAQKKVPGDAKTEWTRFMMTIRDMAEALREKSPAEIVQLAIDGWYDDYLRGAYSNYNMRMEDLRGLVGFAARYQDMSELLAQLILLSSETSDRSADDNDDKLRLTTVHQAKGLEFPVVMIIGVAEGLFPLRRTIESGGDLEEERRLFYVAVTRAKDQLYLCFPKIAGAQGPATFLQPSRFLQIIPKQRYETIRFQSRMW